MRFRNAFRVLVNNFSNVYKLLLFRLVVNALFFSLAYVVVGLGLHTLTESAEAQRIVTLAGEFLRALASGNSQYLSSFSDVFTSAIGDFLYLLGTHIGSIVGSFVGVCLLYLVARFLNGTAVFAMGSILNDKMAFYGNTRFSSAYFKSLAKGTLYQVLYVPLSFVYDVLCLLGCWFFFFFTPSLFSTQGFLSVLIGVALSMGAFICLQALKMTLVSGWIPAIVADGKSVTAGLRQSLGARKGFGSRFSSYLVTIYLVVIVSVVCAVCTFGSALFITVPACYLLILGLQFVCYYEEEGKKYFLSFRKISGADGKPEGMGD